MIASYCSLLVFATDRLWLECRPHKTTLSVLRDRPCPTQLEYTSTRTSKPAIGACQHSKLHFCTTVAYHLIPKAKQSQKELDTPRPYDIKGDKLKGRGMLAPHFTRYTTRKCIMKKWQLDRDVPSTLMKTMRVYFKYADI